MAAPPIAAAGTGTLGPLTGLRRQADYWITVYKRTWRASIVSSFVTPLLYVVAMGVLLGGFVDADPDTLEGAHSYLAFVVPGLIAAHAMQTAAFETTYPVMGMIKWQRIYHSMLATPLQVRDLVAGHLAFVLFRLATTCAVYDAVMVPFGVYGSWWSPLAAFLAQLLVGMSFAAWIFGLSARVASESAFGVLFRLGVIPLFMFSGAFFPIDNLGALGAWLARLTPLWQGVNLSRMLTLDHVTWWVAAVNAGILVALAVLGWRWTVIGLTRRLAS